MSNKEIVIDGLLSQMSEEVRGEIQRVKERKEKAQAELDACDRLLVYYAGKADSLSTLLATAQAASRQAARSTSQATVPSPDPQAASAAEAESSSEPTQQAAPAPLTRGRRSSRAKQK